MAFAAELKNLTPTQRKVVVASFLGWTLDAFDFFILVFVLKDVAKEFGTDVKSVAFAIMLTLAMRPLGALLFGLAADRFGRRPVLMLDVLLYSALEFATAFAPSLTALLILRALFGIAMGGEWGVAASLTMELYPRVRVASYRVSSKLAIQPDTSSRRSSSLRSIQWSDGAACL